MVIDDEKEACYLVKEFFESLNYQVVFAHDGLEGLDRLKSFEPDIVLLDIRMPKLNGLAFLDEMNGHSPKYHVLVTSGAQDKGLFETCRQKGVEGFFTCGS